MDNLDQLRASIRAYCESNMDWGKLTQSNQEFLIDAIAEFAVKGVAKYIAGSIEHADGDFLRDVDHVAEMGPEVIDQWMYFRGAITKRITNPTPTEPEL